MPGFTKKHLDLQHIPNWLTFLKEDLSLKALGLSVVRLPAGKGYTIMHQHEEQEEVYMVINGRGIIHIDGENISLQKGDFINVVPESKRALKAADDSDLIFICAGAVSTGKLSICDNVTIGAGSVVTRDINDAGTYVGSPAKKIK